LCEAESPQSDNPQALPENSQRSPGGAPMKPKTEKLEPMIRDVLRCAHLARAHSLDHLGPVENTPLADERAEEAQFLSIMTERLARKLVEHFAAGTLDTSR